MNMQLVFDSGRKLLHFVADYNSKEIGELLIFKKANINAEDHIDQIIIILF